MATDGIDALVIFGATGDLAKLETFPALVGLVQRGVLDVPVVGVAKSGWGLAQFRDYALHWRFVERGPGRYTYLSGEKTAPFGAISDLGWRLEKTEQEFRWDSHGPVQTLKGGDIQLYFKNGESRQVSFVTLPPRWHLKGGGYGGYRGWHHGDYKGGYYCEHDIWDLSDPKVLTEASTLSDHLIEWRCGNDVGFGIMEYGIGPGYYKYKEVQHLPTF